MIAPNPPTDLVGTAVTESRIDISWTDNSLSETIFKVERQSSYEKVWIEVANFGANKTEYEDSDVVFGVNYSYRIRAYNASEISDYSAIVIHSI